MRKRALSAVAVLALVVGPVLLPATPAAAAEVFIEINPSTVQTGELVGLRASCETNTTPATVRSDAFGTVTVHPQYGFLTATATVASDIEPETYQVDLDCPGGEKAFTDLHVLSRTRPTKGPATGFGGMADDGGSGAMLLGTGLAAIAAGAVLGFVSLRRRRAGA